MASQSLSLVHCCSSLSNLGSKRILGSATFIRLHLEREILGRVLVRNGNPLSLSRRNHSTNTVFSMLPTARPENTQTVDVPKWSARAIKSFAMAELEARKLKYPNTGTEALLMGILIEGTSLASNFLRKNGITLLQVREQTVKLLGKSDMYFFSPEHPPLTEPAQRALDWATDQNIKSGKNGELTVTHLLLGVWSEKNSADHKILALLGFDDKKTGELASFMDRDVALTST